MAIRSYQLTRRSGTEAVATYNNLVAGDTGAPLEPAKFPGAPGAKPDAFADLSISFSGVGVEHAALFGSDDGKGWFPAVNTTGVPVVGGKRDPQHVKADQFQFFAPVIAETAPAGTRVTAETHLANR